MIDCLHYAASKANLSLEYDDTLPENIDKYNLMNTENTTVAWVEISNFNGRQTSVEFYYAPHARIYIGRSLPLLNGVHNAR